MKTTAANDNAGETITIDGTIYIVFGRVPAGANVQKTLGASELLGLRRPNGRKEFCAWSYPDGRIGRVTSVG